MFNTELRPVRNINILSCNKNPEVLSAFDGICETAEFFNEGGVGVWSRFW
jgi:hypothetical protein